MREEADAAPSEGAAPLPIAEAEQPQGGDAKPWVLRLGDYLNGSSGSKQESEPTPWAVRLGSYLNERQPGPWSLIANEKPQDPLVRRSPCPNRREHEG